MRDILNDLEEASPQEQDPVRRAQSKMRRPLPKRFYAAAGYAPCEGGFHITLDGKPVRTPARAEFKVPDESLAREVAAEWEAQAKEIDPANMPFTRLINTAIDGVAAAPEAVFEEILRYASGDHLCYRAGHPEGLVARQTELWDPYLDWAAKALGARLVLSEGVMHVEQPKDAIVAIGVALRRHETALMLTALHTVTSITGSVILALALAEGMATADQVWSAAHLDEDWNIAQWGEDLEAAGRRAFRRKDFDAADRVMASFRNG